MKFKSYVIKRLLLLIPVILGVTFITWFLCDVAGDPLASYVSYSELTKLTDDKRASLEAKYGLDRPWVVRYLEYVLNLLSGDFGLSHALSKAGTPVINLIAVAFPATVELGVVAIIISLVIGIPVGIVSAWGKYPKLSALLEGFTITGMAIPSFVLAIFVQIIIVQFFFSLATTLEFTHIMDWAPYHHRFNTWELEYPNRILFGLLPVTGFLLLDSVLAFDPVLFIDGSIHLIIPALIIAFSQTLIIARMTKDAMKEVLKENYILLAKAKGVPEKVILYRHALRNALFQISTITSLVLANLLTGIIFVEVVFEWPGLGSLVLLGIKSLDLPIVNGFAVFSTIIYVLINLITDLSYAFIDPRIRL
ncbi:MAG: ABC transporter permease [Candidatus Hodarchaeales archaeon]